MKLKPQEIPLNIAKLNKTAFIWHSSDFGAVGYNCIHRTFLSLIQSGKKLQPKLILITTAKYDKTTITE